MNKILFILVLVAAFAFSPSTFSHGGRTNSSGCHNDKKNNSYHCHGQKPKTRYEPVQPANSLVTTPTYQSDSEITKLIIAESIKEYRGNCPCPYNTASNGSRCGARSAYSRPGGFDPICYSSDVTPEMIERYKNKESQP